MLLGADQTEERGCDLSEVTQPFVQKASCGFIMLGQLPQCALGTLSPAQPTASTFQTLNLTAHLDAWEREVNSTAFPASQRTHGIPLSLTVHIRTLLSVTVLAWGKAELLLP